MISTLSFSQSHKKVVHRRGDSLTQFLLSPLGLVSPILKQIPKRPKVPNFMGRKSDVSTRIWGGRSSKGSELAWQEKVKLSQEKFQVLNLGESSESMNEGKNLQKLSTLQRRGFNKNLQIAIPPNRFLRTNLVHRFNQEVPINNSDQSQGPSQAEKSNSQIDLVSQNVGGGFVAESSPKDSHGTTFAQVPFFNFLMNRGKVSSQHEVSKSAWSKGTLRNQRKTFPGATLHVWGKSGVTRNQEPREGHKFLDLNEPADSNLEQLGGTPHEAETALNDLHILENEIMQDIPLYDEQYDGFPGQGLNYMDRFCNERGSPSGELVNDYSFFLSSLTLTFLLIVKPH